MLKRPTKQDSTTPIQDRGSLQEAVQDKATEVMIKAFHLWQSLQYVDAHHSKEAALENSVNEAAKSTTTVDVNILETLSEAVQEDIVEITKSKLKKLDNGP